MIDLVGRLPRRVIIIILLAVAMGGILLIIPVRLPYVISSIGQIQPARKWILTTGTNGQLVSGMINYRTGMSDGYRVSQFAREGTMTFQFRPDIVAGAYLQAGDTAGTIYSSETEELLAELRGQLASTKATLAAEIIGEKGAIIREFEARYEQAKERVAGGKQILERLKALHERQLIPQEEYDIAMNQDRLTALEVEIAEAQLLSARTGIKPEQIELINTRIAALSDQLNVLSKRIASFSIVSPISGRVSRIYSADTLLVVSDISTYIALIPIKIADIPYVSPGQWVRIKPGGKMENISGHMMLIDGETHYLSGQQTCTGSAAIDSCATELSVGLIGECAIDCGEITIFDYFKRLIGIF